MGGIEWLPIEDMPDAFKDGREVLLAIDDAHVVGRWSTTTEQWLDGLLFTFVLDSPTKFAELEQPA